MHNFELPLLQTRWNDHKFLITRILSFLVRSFLTGFRTFVLLFRRAESGTDSALIHSRKFIVFQSFILLPAPNGGTLPAVTDSERHQIRDQLK